MSDLRTVVEQMTAEGQFQNILINPLAQFGPEDRPLLGATLLPERRMPANEYTETQIKYRTIVANDGTRYSPSQKKGNDIIGKMKVSLAEQDIAAEFTAADYDALLEVANLNNLNPNSGNPTMQGVAAVTRWYNTRILQALKVKIEKMRWEAMIDASVPLRGDNGYSEDIAISNPAGHRVAASGVWSNNSYDPFDDLFALKEFAAGKGYDISRIIAPRPVLFKLLNNAKVKAAAGGYISVSAGALVGVTGRVATAKLNDYLQEHELPAIETYDTQYRTQTSSAYYLRRDALLMVSTTGRDQSIDLGDGEYMPLRDTIGYVGVGRPAGAQAPGIKEDMRYFNNKPPRIEAEAWQTTFPVIQDPESLYCINSIS